VVHEPVVALVGDDNTRLFWVDGGIWEVGRVAERALGDGLEQRRFTDVREADLATTVNVRTRRRRKAGRSLTMPLFKLLPGRPRRSFSSFTCFLGGIFFFLGADA